jgi:hypothetical protein
MGKKRAEKFSGGNSRRDRRRRRHNRRFLEQPLQRQETTMLVPVEAPSPMPAIAPTLLSNSEFLSSMATAFLARNMRLTGNYFWQLTWQLAKSQAQQTLNDVSYPEWCSGVAILFNIDVNRLFFETFMMTLYKDSLGLTVLVNVRERRMAAQLLEEKNAVDFRVAVQVDDLGGVRVSRLAARRAETPGILDVPLEEVLLPADDPDLTEWLDDDKSQENVSVAEKPADVSTIAARESGSVAALSIPAATPAPTPAPAPVAVMQALASNQASEMEDLKSQENVGHFIVADEKRKSQVDQDWKVALGLAAAEREKLVGILKPKDSYLASLKNQNKKDQKDKDKLDAKEVIASQQTALELSGWISLEGSSKKKGGEEKLVEPVPALPLTDEQRIAALQNLSSTVSNPMAAAAALPAVNSSTPLALFTSTPAAALAVSAVPALDSTTIVSSSPSASISARASTSVVSAAVLANSMAQIISTSAGASTSGTTASTTREAVPRPQNP